MLRAATASSGTGMSTGPKNPEVSSMAMATSPCASLASHAPPHPLQATHLGQGQSGPRPEGSSDWGGGRKGGEEG